jgi:hypothetical protein
MPTSEEHDSSTNKELGYDDDVDDRRYSFDDGGDDSDKCERERG